MSGCSLNFISQRCAALFNDSPFVLMLMGFFRRIGFIFTALILIPVGLAIDIERVADISYPWGIDQLDQNRIIVTSKLGSVFSISLSDYSKTQIKNIPSVRVHRQGGLLDVAVERQGEVTRVYLCYSKPMGNGISVAVHEATLKDDSLDNGRDIYISNVKSGSGVHFGCRLQLLNSDLFLSHGDRGRRNHAQDGSLDSGSVIRLFKSEPGDEMYPWSWGKAVHSIGHRNPQGLSINPRNQELWLHEHGPRGGDEINVVEEGGNYGWPRVCYGEEYSGGEIGLNFSPEGYIDPVWKWIPSIGPSGMMFYQGDMFPEIAGQLLVGSLKFGKIVSVALDEASRPTSEIDWLTGIGRVRDLFELDDGSILVLTDERRDGLLRVSR